MIRDPFIVFCTEAFIVAGVCVLALWLIALIRIRHFSLAVVAVGSFLTLVGSAIQFVLYYHFNWLLQLMGQKGYKIFYYAFSAGQLLTALITVVGLALFVSWLCAAHSRPNQSLQPTAGRSED
jgi:hypothetical protein